MTRRTVRISGRHTPGTASAARDDDEITTLEYPLEQHPVKVASIKLDKTPLVQGKLAGIKGQYLIFSDGRVMNMRSHSGYRIRLAT